MVTLIGIFGFAFKLEIYAIFVIAGIAAMGWVLCKDLLPTFIAMMIISMVPLARYGEVGYFSNAYFVLFYLVPAFIARMFIYRMKFRIGRFFIPTLCVSVAITLGGLFYLSANDYFTMPGLYYVLGLGFGMLLVNFIMEANTPTDVDLSQFFAKMMLGVGIMGISMIITGYIKLAYLFNSNFYLFSMNFQWGNNLSNALLLSMPFAFYLSTRKKYSVLYFIIGIFEYLALILSLSRGGIIFGTLMFPLIVIATLVIAKKDRKILLITLLVMVAAIITLSIILLTPIFYNLTDNIAISDGESRILMYKLAWENFLAHPIFGTGLAYNPKLYYFPQAMCIYWYHSTFFQIIASLGIVGLLAYGIQSFYRIRSLWEVKNSFNIFVFLSVMGFAAYSMVNTGYFIPFPNMAALITVFIIVDRNNKYIKANPKLLEKELLYTNKKATVN